LWEKTENFLPECFALTLGFLGFVLGVEKPGFCGGYQGLSVFGDKETRFLGFLEKRSLSENKIASTYPLPSDRYPKIK
jgi:hypothetical protein